MSSVAKRRQCAGSPIFSLGSTQDQFQVVRAEVHLFFKRFRDNWSQG